MNNTNSNKPSLILISSIIFILLSSLVLSADLQSVSQDEKDNFYEVLDGYYSSFGEKDLDNYLSYQFTNHLSEEELSAKKNLIKNIWSEFSSGYAIDDFESWVFAVDGSVAIVEFDLFANIMNTSYETVKTYEQSMTATFFNTEDGWKIFNIVPTSVFEFNTVVELMSEEIQYGVKKVEDPLQKVITDGSCDYEGRCFKRGPSMLRPSEVKKAICNLDVSAFKDIDSFSLENIHGVQTLIGNDKTISVSIDDGLYEFYYLFKDNLLSPVSATEDIDFSVKTDSCTLERIEKGGDPTKEYKKGNIKIKGKSTGSKISTGIAKLIFNVYSWFAPKAPFELWIEAETGILENAGKYSFIGPTSRGPGELYLGTKNSFATYEFESKHKENIYLSIIIMDDGVHKDGSRNAVFVLNGNELKYNHISKNTVTENSIWKMELLGTVELKKGKNVLIIKKPEQTSAAFIVDKFVFSEEEINQE